MLFVCCGFDDEVQHIRCAEKVAYLATLAAMNKALKPQTPPSVAAWEVTLSARKVIPCVRWPATGITAHSL